MVQSQIALGLLLLLSVTAQARQWTQPECKALASVATTAVSYRELKMELPQVLAEFHEAVEEAALGKSPLVRLEGDYEIVEALVTAAYHSTWNGEQIHRIVYAACDRGGKSRFVRET